MVTPLLGMLGTVLGMIDVFSTLDALEGGAGAILAGGIGAALISTAAGLTIAIPTLMAHRLLSGGRWLTERAGALSWALAAGAGPLSFPRRRLEAPALELAPLVDVLFLLLVFFAVATRFPDPPGAITVVRPAVSAQGAVLERAVRLSLTAEGVAALQGTPLPEARSARLEALRQAAAAGRSELSLAADQGGHPWRGSRLVGASRAGRLFIP